MSTIEGLHCICFCVVGAVHIRFDSEDETVKEQEEVCSMNNITDDFESTVPFPNLIASNQNDQTSSIKATEQKVNVSFFLYYYKNIRDQPGHKNPVL